MKSEGENKPLRPQGEPSRTIGIKPRPDLVADELAIRGLAYWFADAVNRRDTDAFGSLWDDNAVWEIGAPLPSSATGLPDITSVLLKRWEPLEFFVQHVHSGVVTIDGDRATSRWSIHEIARRRDGGPYDNLGVYEDELVKRDGSWRFVRRTYHYVWLDLKSAIGGDAIP